MTYPSLEQYSQALQAPQVHLLDSVLKSGTVRMSGLGMPLALCGGFALTYTVDAIGKRYAVRCFHKEAPDLERRYQVISAKLRQMASPWFLPFEFNPKGIRIQGQEYPVVKMEWALGETLSEFLEREHGSSSSLNRLRATLARLSEFLEGVGIAHGDIQPGNVMVSQNGGAVQLIDYDGMYIDAFQGARATELGQINFQHPQRSATHFNSKIDRFSFIALDVALQALAADPDIWRRSHSDPDAVVFRRADYLSPGASPVFKEALSLPGIADHVRNLAQVALAPMDHAPSLADFLQARGIPQVSLSFLGTRQVARAPYQGAYPVLNATDYEAVLLKVGDRIELIGRIDSVVPLRLKDGKPYLFINFSDWLGNAVKLCIWPQGLSALGNDAPDKNWVGRWITISGLVDPVYRGKSKRGLYTHVSITVSQRGQMQPISEEEARYRLDVRPPGSYASLKNSSVIRNMSEIPVSRAAQVSAVAKPIVPMPKLPPKAMPKSGNQQVIEQMLRQQSAQLKVTPQLKSGPSALSQKKKAPLSLPVLPNIAKPKVQSIVNQARTHKTLNSLRVWFCIVVVVSVILFF